MHSVTCKIKNYIQPFERQLALDELQAISGSLAIPLDGDQITANSFSVKTKNGEKLRQNLAYWQSIEWDSNSKITEQLRHEATSNVARNGIALVDFPNVVRKLVDEKLPKKRCLRYGPHGIHEYRGKFFPQLVRSLINAVEVPVDGIVVDPMCGSGTTLIESALSSRNTYGLDINPLSVFISKVKCDTLNLSAEELITSLASLEKLISSSSSTNYNFAYLSSLNTVDQSYLMKWFAPETLIELDRIAIAILKTPNSKIRDFFRVSLSNILRTVSWQKNADLRVRKEIVQLAKGEVLSLFMKETRRSTRLVVAFLSERVGKPVGKYNVFEANATAASKALPNLIGQVDTVITSPPYATALPYLDTDRLSLLYLGLLNRQEHRLRDLQMIGNREVSEKVRAELWETYMKGKDNLPSSVCNIIEKIDHLNSIKEVGFRRRNLAALLSKYFFDMREVLIEQAKLLKSGGTLFMVVGNNRTTAGGIDVQIKTSELLADIAVELGYELQRSLPMEMLVSRDIFKKNAMASERIITFKKA